MKLRNWLCVLLLQLICSLATASELALSGSEAELDLTPYLELYQDQGARLELADVSADMPFQHASTALLRPGYTDAAIWLRLTVSNASSAAFTRWISIQQARLQEVSLFRQHDGRWQRLDSGASIPFGDHPLAAVGAVFPLRLAAMEKTTIYLRVASQTSIVITPTLWMPVSFLQASTKQTVLDTLFLGGLALTAIYALLMFSTLRERTFLLHTLAMFSYCLFEISFSGYGHMYFWPNATVWTTKSILFFGATTALGLLLFIRDLLSTAQHLPRWDKVLQFFLLGLLLLLLVTPFTSYRMLVQVALLFGSLALLAIVITTVLTVRQHFSAVRFYLLAFSTALIGNFARNLSVYGLIDASDWINYVRPLYTVIGSLFMLAAVVDNINRAKKEKEKAQQEVLETYSSYHAKLEREVKERTTDLNAALLETRNANHARSRLLAYIGHDLRAPLATIISYVRRLNRDASPQALAYQSTIEQCATHQLELIDDLVEYARGELDRLELHAVPTYLHAWLAGVSHQAELLASQHGNRFSAQLDASLPAAVQIDPKRLRQVLLNLLSNAAKFTSAGTIDFSVRHEALGAEQVALTFSVTDSGSGIAPQALERIFLPFERLQSEQPGSGLGLSIARQIVRSMDSELQVHSTPGQGSRFSFRVVLASADESEVALPPQMLKPQEQPLQARGKRMLVVDDDAASRDYLLEMLTAAEVDVIAAANGDEALRLLQAQQVDAVLSDQNMPHMDGWALLHQLRTRYPTLPVVLCSAMPPQAPEGMATAWRFDGQLLKPVMPEQLASCLEHLFATPATSSESSHASLPPAVLAALHDYIALGSISDIDMLAQQLQQDHPQHAVLAAQLRAAAQRIDFAAMTALLAEPDPTA
jgi:signal transduction histidine kinase/DNA-binding response OmpR family regulator